MSDADDMRELPEDMDPEIRSLPRPRPHVYDLRYLDLYDLRRLVMFLAWLAGFAGLIMGDIWLSGHI